MRFYRLPARLLAFKGVLFGYLSLWLACEGMFAASSSVPVDKQPEAFTIRDNVNLVVIDASVRDSRGGFVSGLSKENFQVLDDGHERKLAQFSKVDTPVTVGLIVDNSGSMRTKRPEIVMAGLQFARASNAADEFFVVNFNNAVYSGMPAGQPFTDRLQVLRSALYVGTPVGQTALYDAVAQGLQQLENGHHESRTLIVVSDGGDNVSKLRLPELMRLIEASRATIYTIGLLDPEDRDLNPGVLRKMSAWSGGEFFLPSSLDQVSAVFQKISQDIRSRYTLAFVPDDEHDRHTVHALRVIAHAADGRKLPVRARSFYLSVQ